MNIKYGNGVNSWGGGPLRKKRIVPYRLRLLVKVEELEML